MKFRLLIATVFVSGLLLCTNLTLAQPVSSTSESSDAPVPVPPGMVSLFDGKTLDGWIQLPINSTTFSASDITDMVSFAKKLSEKSDAVSAFLNDRLDEPIKTDLAAYSATSTTAKAVKSALVKSLNKIISGESIYDENRFQNVRQRPETIDLCKKNPQGPDLMRLNRILLEDAYPAELPASPAVSWIVKDGAMASTGAGRGVIYTKDDYSNYRLIFTMRQVSGNHQPCFLIFCTRPEKDKKPLDALGGIQFQVPNGGHWDYRPGQNKGGVGFTSPTKTKFDNKQWCRVEILVDVAAGTARMAVAQPVGAKAVENLDYNVPEAGKTGPIAWQMHNGGILDEYKDVWIEINPKVKDLITTK
jgi:3-keto-disaccharide hydrolase